MTADRNIVQPEAVLKYQIMDPEGGGAPGRGAGTVVRDAVVAALTRTLGEMAIDTVLVDGQKALAAQALRARKRGSTRKVRGHGWWRSSSLRSDRRRRWRVSSTASRVPSSSGKRSRRGPEPSRAGSARGGRGRPEQIRAAEADEATRLADARGAASPFVRSRRSTAAVPRWSGSGSIARPWSTCCGRRQAHRRAAGQRISARAADSE